MACNGPKKDTIHFFVHPQRSRVIFGKTHFVPIFDLCLVAKQPIFKAFWDFRRPPRAQNVPKTLVLALHVVQDHF